MTFIGFFVRRGIKAVTHKAIDNCIDDKDTARAVKKVANVGINIIGATVSFFTADVAGMADTAADIAIDHGTDMAIDHGTDLALDHGSDLAFDHHADMVIDHGSSYYDHGSYYDHTNHGSGYSDSHSIKFGAGGACSHYGCGCIAGVYATGGSICLTCHHSYDDHW